MKKAVVISGGGSKGAFAVGVIKHLLENFSLDIPIWVGTSTGALIAPLAALNKINELERLYTSVTDSNIFQKFNLATRVNENSIFKVDPLYNLIKETYTDAFFSDLIASNKEVYINTVCLQGEEIVVYTNAPHAQSTDNYKIEKFKDARQFRLAILASACQPVFMPPIKINEHIANHPARLNQYVDGGVRQYAGLETAIEAGALEIFTILHAAKKFLPDNIQYTKLPQILMKTIGTFINDVGINDLLLPYHYNNALKYIDNVKRTMLSHGLTQADIDSFFIIPAAIFLISPR